jgi:hypothetical protein
MPVNPALGKKKQEDLKFEASLDYSTTKNYHLKKY